MLGSLALETTGISVATRSLELGSITSRSNCGSIIRYEVAVVPHAIVRREMSGSPGADLALPVAGQLQSYLPPVCVA